MTNSAVIAWFCDSVRDEVAGSASIIGVFPDTIVVESFPALLPQLTVYGRVNFVAIDTLPDVEWLLRFPNGSEEARSRVPAESIRQNALDVKSGVGSVMTEISAAPFRMPMPGTLQAIARINGQEIIAGAVHFTLEKGS